MGYDSRGTTATRWLLVCVLFVGVVGMHHLAMSGITPDSHMTAAATQGEHEPERPSQSHDMLNMCLAVLGTVIPLLLLVLLRRDLSPPAERRAHPSAAWPRAPSRAPPAGGRTLLSAVCVLRL